MSGVAAPKRRSRPKAVAAADADADGNEDEGEDPRVSTFHEVQSRRQKERQAVNVKTTAGTGAKTPKLLMISSAGKTPKSTARSQSLARESAASDNNMSALTLREDAIARREAAQEAAEEQALLREAQTAYASEAQKVAQAAAGKSSEYARSYEYTSAMILQAELQVVIQTRLAEAASARADAEAAANVTLRHQAATVAVAAGIRQHAAVAVEVRLRHDLEKAAASNGTNSNGNGATTPDDLLLRTVSGTEQQDTVRMKRPSTAPARRHKTTDPPERKIYNRPGSAGPSSSFGSGPKQRQQEAGDATDRLNVMVHERSNTNRSSVSRPASAPPSRQRQHRSKSRGGYGGDDGSSNRQRPSSAAAGATDGSIAGAGESVDDLDMSLISHTVNHSLGGMGRMYTHDRPLSDMEQWSTNKSAMRAFQTNLVSSSIMANPGVDRVKRSRRPSSAASSRSLAASQHSKSSSRSRGGGSATNGSVLYRRRQRLAKERFDAAHGLAGPGAGTIPYSGLAHNSAPNTGPGGATFTRMLRSIPTRGPTGKDGSRGTYVARMSVA